MADTRVNARMSDEQRRAMKEFADRFGVTNISEAVRQMILADPFPAAIEEFVIATGGDPGKVSPANAMAKVLSLGLGLFMTNTPPCLRPGDVEPLGSAETAATFLRWRDAIKAEHARAEAAASGKVLAGDVAMIPWVLEPIDDDYFRLVWRFDEPSFQSWVKAASFKWDKLTKVQREGMRSLFMAEQARESASRASGSDK